MEAALTLRALAEVDPTCANNLLSCGVTTLRAIREIVVVEKVSSVLFVISTHSCLNVLVVEINFRREL